MLYREIIAVCSEIHKKHINTLCGQNVELQVRYNRRHEGDKVRAIYMDFRAKRRRRSHIPKTISFSWYM
jgi:hypothetical protein